MKGRQRLVTSQQMVVKGAIFFGKAVLILSSADDDHGKARDLPGGIVQLGEDPLDALRREIQEETGLEVSVIAPVRLWSFVSSDGRHFLGVTVVCISRHRDVVLSPEHDRYQWIEVDDIPTGWAERSELEACWLVASRPSHPAQATSRPQALGT